MTRESASKMFFAAALFNWMVAVSLFFIPEVFFTVFFVAPAPEQTLWVQQFAGLVFFFGLGYYWASRDFDRNVQIIRLAVWAKSGVVVIGLLNVLMGDISWQFMLAASVDALFVVLFIQALNSRLRWQPN